MKLINVEFDPDTLNGTRWFYDETEPRRIINFVERYLTHRESQHAGKPFTLQPLQRGWIQEFYGVKDRETGLDRYRYWYNESAKGLGKTPLGTALCLAELLVRNVDSALVINTAASFDQANITFDRAKWHLDQLPPALRNQVTVNQRLIYHRGRDARWKIMTGQTTTGSGSAPSLLYVDELHEIKDKQAVLFGVMDGNLAKRDNSKCIITTNAGLDQTTLCWRWHEKALAEIAARRDGKPVETDLFPTVYAADPQDDIYDKASWRKANPLIGVTIRESEYEKKAAKAKVSTGDRLEFERLWLTKWTKQAKQWLSPDDLKACIVSEIPSDVRLLPYWIGYDHGPTDDITAAVYVYCDRETDTIWIDCLNWIPRPAADNFEAQNGVPYDLWRTGDEAKGIKPSITIVNAKTLARENKEAIANEIIAKAGETKPQVFCPDKSFAVEVIKTISDKGWDVEEMGSSAFALDAATRDFEARVISGRVKIINNPCYLWQLSNISLEVNAQEKVKPQRMGGVNNNPRKIDAGMATMYALSRAILYMAQGDTSEPEPTPIDLSYYATLHNGV